MPRDPHLDRRHLLRVTQDPDIFRELFAALRQAGARAGWLELADVPPPPSLGRAADLGALRAVAAGTERTVTTKTRRGPAVLQDLLREHFRGCAAVLVRGDVDAPLLEPAPGGAWLVHGAGAARQLDTSDLVAALRRPHPFTDHRTDPEPPR